MNTPHCPRCQSENTYQDQWLFVCPDCAHEWTEQSSENEDTLVVKDAYGTPLSDGDSVTLIKDLKLKGSTSVLKVGTKVKHIKLVDSDHNIDCSLPGMGALSLKSEFVKKSI